MVQHSSTCPARVDLLLFFFFSFRFSAVDLFGIIPELKEACIKAVPRSYITWQHAKCSSDRVAYVTRTVDWLIGPCQTERQIHQKLDEDSINWKAGQNKNKNGSSLRSSLLAGGGGLPSFSPLVILLRPSSHFCFLLPFRPSISSSTAQVKRFQMGGYP